MDYSESKGSGSKGNSGSGNEVRGSEEGFGFSTGYSGESGSHETIDKTNIFHDFILRESRESDVYFIASFLRLIIFHTSSARCSRSTNGSTSFSTSGLVSSDGSGCGANGNVSGENHLPFSEGDSGSSNK